MATQDLSMKLLIDTKTDKLCFAEAGSDVVEFLSGLLSLPLGAVSNLLPKEGMDGSIGNVLGLDPNYKSKEARLSPAVNGATLYWLQQLLGSHLRNGIINFFTCKGSLPTTASSYHRSSCNYSCTCPRDSCGYLSDTMGTTCHMCKSPMNKLMTMAPPEAGISRPQVFMAAANKTYTIKDDLSVTPASNVMSSITLLAQCGVKDISALQEKSVNIGKEEALAILVASLKSKTVLTDVFLPKKNARCKREPPEEVI